MGQFRKCFACRSTGSSVFIDVTRRRGYEHDNHDTPKVEVRCRKGNHEERKVTEKKGSIALK